MNFLNKYGEFHCQSVQSKQKHYRLYLKAFACRVVLIVFSSLLLLSTADGNPTGGQVVAGKAKIFSSKSQTLQVNQISNKAIINWQTFNINKNETTHFQQPSSRSIILNRINPTNGPSGIYGHLTANGQVWLINPAGIWFGPSAYVNVAGIIATTASLSNHDFMTGHYHFIQSDDWHGAVINNGKIYAYKGAVALFAPGVENNDLIVANLGEVVLASGKEYTVDFRGDQLIQYSVDKEIIDDAVDPSGKALKYRVSNSGHIIANGGSVMMTVMVAKHVINNIINMNGIIQAKSVKSKNGEIILMAGENGNVQVSGKIDASGKYSGESGGSIKILGKNISVTNNATIDTSGNNGGGVILIGGNAHGNGSEINANDTFIDKGVNINADALINGNGGKVVVWSNDQTQFHGLISARSGINGGHGGFIETSGKNYLDVSGGNVIASAQSGAPGTWLLDPRNVTINTSSTTCTTSSCFSAGDPTIYTPDTNSSNVNVSDILAALEGGTSVTITTGTDGTQAGTIKVNTAINKASGLTPVILTLDSSNNGGTITISNDITSTSGQLGITLNSNNAITIAANITTNGGDFLSASANGTSISSNAIGYTIDAGSGTVKFNVNTSGVGSSSFSMGSNSAIKTTNTGVNAVDIEVNNAGGTGSATLRDIQTGSGGTITVATNTAGTSAGGDITQPTGTLDTGSGAVDLYTPIAAGRNIGTSGSNILIIANSMNASTGTGGIFVTNTGSNSLDLGSINTTGKFTLTSTASTSISGSGPLTITGATTLAAGAGQDISLDNVNNDFGIIGITSGNNVVIKDSNDLDLGTSAISGTLNITTNGAITQSSSVAVSGIATLDAGNLNDITLNNSGNDFSSVAVSTGNNINIRDANTLDLALSNISGNLTVLAAGLITQSSPISVSGDASFTAGSNAINLPNINNHFSGNISLSNSGANDVAISNASSLQIGASSVGQNLVLSAGGNITESGAINASGGTITISATAVNSDILLDTQANNLGSNAIVFGGVQSNIRDLGVQNSNSGAVLSDFSNLTSLRNLTLVYTGTNVNLPALTLYNGGNLTVTAKGVAGGAINQTGTLMIPGSSSFTSTTGTASLRSIILTDTNNDFGGDITVTNSGSGAVSLKNSGLLKLSDISMGTGALTLDGDGITQTSGSAITQSNGASTVTISGNSGNVYLSNSTNNITGVVTITNSAATIINLANNTTLKLGDVTLIGNSDLTAAGNNITMNSNSTINADIGNVTLNAGSGTLTTNNNDKILSTGVITLIADHMSLSTNANSQIGGTGLSVGSAANVIFEQSTSGVTIGIAGAAGTLNLGINELNKIFATNIRIGNNQSGDLAVNSGSTWSPAAIFANNGVFTLDSGGAITQGAGVDLSSAGASLLFRDASSVDFSNSNNLIASIAADISGNLQLVSSTPITITSMTDDIGTVNGINTAGDVTLTSSDALIESSSASIIAGLISLDAGGVITLTNSNNNFSSLLISNSSDVNVRNVGALVLTNSNIGGDLIINADGGITLSGDTSVSREVNFTTSNSPIIFNATLLGNPNVSLSSGASGDVTFNVNENFGGLTIATANNVTNKALLTLTSYTQNSGAVTDFGNTGANVTGDMDVTAYNAVGVINVGALSLDLTLARLTGTVAGLSGQDAVDQIVLAQPVLIDRQFFDGIDLGTISPAPPTPPAPPIPVEPDLSVVPAVVASTMNAERLTNLNNDIVIYSGGMNYAYLIDMLESGKNTCVSLGSSIKLCGEKSE